MPSHIRLLAGRRALDAIRRDGLVADRVEHIIGGAGGPKALALVGLDAALFGQWLTPGPQPRWLVGSSIATWRFLCALHPEPRTTFAHFAELYLALTFSQGARRPEITATMRGMAQALLAHCGGADRMLAHPDYRLALVTARSRGLVNSEHPWLLTPALGSAFLLNLLSPRLRDLYFQRAVLHDPRGVPPLGEARLGRALLAPLSADTLVDALLASTSIPFIMDAVASPQGWPTGTYRDGGMIDYHHHHLDTAAGGIVLFPHFTPHLTASWFDKTLPERLRRSRVRATDDVLVIAPSPEYLARMPQGRIPGRADYKRMPDAERVKHWRVAVDESRRLGDEFLELAATGRLEGAVQPLPTGERG